MKDEHNRDMSALDKMTPEQCEELNLKVQAAMDQVRLNTTCKQMDEVISENLNEGHFIKQMVKKAIPDMMNQIGMELPLDAYGMILVNLGLSCLCRKEICELCDETAGKLSPDGKHKVEAAFEDKPSFSVNLNRLSGLFGKN